MHPNNHCRECAVGHTVGTLPTHAFTTPCQQCSAQCYSLPFPISCNLCYIFHPALHTLHCRGHATARPKMRRQCSGADSAAFALFSPYLPVLTCTTKIYSFSCSSKMAWHWQYLLLQMPQQPLRSKYSAYPGAYTLMQGACMPM